MGERAWQDMIVGDRMQVDQQFAERVRRSSFSSQEWGLIMTAVELEVEGDGDDATLVADTSQVPAIVPELDRISREMGAYGGETGRGGGSGIIGSLMSTLGLGGRGADEETVREAEQLAGEYASELEAHLRQNGKWSLVGGSA